MDVCHTRGSWINTCEYFWFNDIWEYRQKKKKKNTAKKPLPILLALKRRVIYFILFSPGTFVQSSVFFW